MSHYLLVLTMAIKLKTRKNSRGIYVAQTKSFYSIQGYGATPEEARRNWQVRYDQMSAEPAWCGKVFWLRSTDGLAIANIAGKKVRVKSHNGLYAGFVDGRIIEQFFSSISEAEAALHRHFNLIGPSFNPLLNADLRPQS